MKYRNISDQDLALIGHGIVKAGETIEVRETLTNANFELVKESPKAEKPKEESKTNEKTS